MARKKIKTDAAAERDAPQLRKVHPIQPWSVQHHPDHSEIEAYSEIEGNFTIIADIKTVNHVAIANFITALANAYNQDGDLFEEAIATLEQFLQIKKVDFSIEQDAENIVRRARLQAKG